MGIEGQTVGWGGEVRGTNYERVKKGEGQTLTGKVRGGQPLIEEVRGPTVYGVKRRKTGKRWK